MSTRLRINGAEHRDRGLDRRRTARRERRRAGRAVSRGRAQWRGGTARRLGRQIAGCRRSDRDHPARGREDEPHCPRNVTRMSDPLAIAGIASLAAVRRHGALSEPQVLIDALAASGAELVTASIRRIGLDGDAESLVDLCDRYRLLPNTAGCVTARDAILTAQLAREALGHELGQARADRRPRDALSRCRAAARGCRRARRDGFACCPIAMRIPSPARSSPISAAPR